MPSHNDQLLQEMNELGVKFIALLLSSVLQMLALSWENLCTSKPGRLDANHDLELHSLHTLFTLKFKSHQLHAVRLY